MSMLARESSARVNGKSSSSSLMGVGDTRTNGGAEEAFDEALDSVRVREELELDADGEREGTPLEYTLEMLPIVAVESRRELVTLFMESRDILRILEDESSSSVSSSEMGDGPGTGGSGKDGGRDGGGFATEGDWGM